MREGFDEVEKAVEASKAPKGGDFLRHLVWKDDRNEKGEQYQHVVRFLPFPVITCETYDFVECDDGIKRSFVSGPSLGLEEGKDPEYDEKYLTDYIAANGIKVAEYKTKDMKPAKAKSATIGIAVIREEVTEQVDGVARRVTRDKIVEREYTTDSGETKKVKGVQAYLVKQAHKNFWSMLTAYNTRYGCIWDRDYVIERRRNDTDTSYAVMPCDPDPELTTKEAILERYQPSLPKVDDKPFTLRAFVLALADPKFQEEHLSAQAAGAPPGSKAKKKDGETSEPAITDGKVETQPLTPGESASDESKVTASEESRFSSLKDDLVKNR
jgi:hypothetical protein